jgi:hypothetical protein
VSDIAIYRQMTSYDVSVADTCMAHPDLNELLNALLSMAEMLLTKQGEFLPIGAIMLSDGEIRHVAGKIEGDDHPGSQPLIDLLSETFLREAARGKLRAAGICYDVLTVPPGNDQKQDAICCGLEHCLGEAVDVFKPYVKKEDGNFQYGEIFAVKRTPQFFCQIPRG